MLFKKYIKFIVILLITCNTILPYPIDLTELPVYVKKGFDINNCNISEKQTTEYGFYQVPPNPGNRKIQITELPLDIPKRNFFEVRKLPKEDFTFLIFLNLTQKDLEKIISPSLFFAEIGESWRIYFNNQLIDNKIKEEKEMNQKDVIVPVPRNLILAGTNTLCLHIKGDPLSKETGFYYGKPYYFDELIELMNLKKQYLIIFLVTVYSTIGIFNLLFFIKKFNDKYYLFFGLFSLTISLYIFFRSSLIYDFLPPINSYILFRFELISLFLTIPLFCLFLDSIFIEKNFYYNLSLKICIYHGLILSIIAIFSPDNSLYDITLIWQITAPILLILILIIIISKYIKEFKSYLKKFNILYTFYLSIINTIPGNLLLGTFFIILLTLVDIYLNIKKIRSPGLSNYGILVFLTGASLRVIYNLMNLINEVEILNKRLKGNINQLKKAYNQIQISEEKYRFLFNNTSDILITLNQDGIITNISDSFNEILMLNKEEFFHKHILNIIYKDHNRSQMFDLYEEQILNTLNQGSTLKIQLPLIAYGDIPFKYFDVSIEKIYKNQNQNEYLFRATPVKKNPLLKYLEKEYIKFIFNTDIYLIDNIISKLTEDLNEIIDDMELSVVRVGLREILINAIEHGNLEITNEEKTTYLEQGNYHEILKERLNNPNYANRKIIVEYKFTLDKLYYKITDEGKGFDVEKYLKNKNAHLSDSIHGRGIFIAKNAFDVIQYNKKGNMVVLIKKISIKN
jgi:anti-sigma regulatory factor (Ser/Thr protein kinase)/PAS domain-containing protein